MALMRRKSWQRWKPAEPGGSSARFSKGQRRFGLAVRLQQDGKLDPQGFASIPVAAKDGLLIPLGQVANVSVEEGPVLVSRENIQRRIVVQLNVRGRDLGSFIADAQQAIQAGLKLPTGYIVEWGGQFENLQRASARLDDRRPAGVVPDLCLALHELQLHRTALS